MASTGRIEGRVFSHDGTPLADVRILLSPGFLDLPDFAAASTSSAGDYSLADVEPGAYTVRVSSTTHGEHATRVSVRPTQTTRIDFILPS